MQDSIDNKLYRVLKYRVQDLALATEKCLDKISRKEPDLAKQKLADLRVIFPHLVKSLKDTNYTNLQTVNEGMEWYCEQIKRI